MQVTKIDVDGFYLEDVILEHGEVLPVDCIVSKPPNGLYKPKWDNEKWVEGYSEEYINSLPKITQHSSELDILRDYVLDIEFRMIMKELEG